jgi:hypothetical protein
MTMGGLLVDLEADRSPNSTQSFTNNHGSTLDSPHPHDEQYYDFNSGSSYTTGTIPCPIAGRERSERMLLKPQSRSLKRQRISVISPSFQSHDQAAQSSRSLQGEANTIWNRETKPSSLRDFQFSDRQNILGPVVSQVENCDMGYGRKSGSGEVKINLSPCHICHQRPRVKSDLDSYADCQGCGARTCYICMRECLGSATYAAHHIEGDFNGNHNIDDAEMSFGLEASLMDLGDGIGHQNEHDGDGITEHQKGDKLTGQHRGMVCSRCARECGADGDVQCNGCLGLGWG